MFNDPLEFQFETIIVNYNKVPNTPIIVTLEAAYFDSYDISHSECHLIGATNLIFYPNNDFNIKFELRDSYDNTISGTLSSLNSSYRITNIIAEETSTLTPYGLRLSTGTYIRFENQGQPIIPPVGPEIGPIG